MASPLNPPLRLLVLVLMFWILDTSLLVILPFMWLCG